MPPPSVQLSPSPSSRFIAFRNAFITGLFLLAPLGVSVYVVNFLLFRIGNPASNIFFGWLKNDLSNSGLADYLINAVSTLIVVALITALGYLSNYFFGRWLLSRAELLILRVPIVGMVYRTTKQIVDTFHGQKKAAFQKVVMIEFPRPGLYSVGFVTSTAEGEIGRESRLVAFDRPIELPCFDAVEARQIAVEHDGLAPQSMDARHRWLGVHGVWR